MFLRYFCLAIAIAAVCLPQASGVAFVAGVVVMVTALGVHFLVGQSLASGPRSPDHSFPFAFATGALLTCAHGNYALAAFIAMFTTFQISRERDNVHGPAEYLPDTRSFIKLAVQRVNSLIKERNAVRPPSLALRSLQAWIQWLLPAATVVTTLTRKAMD